MARSGVWLFGVLALAATVAFWPSYLSRVAAEEDFSLHLHGLVMAAWLAMLITQAWLMRTGRRSGHRALGRLSYGLAPLVVLSTLWVVRHRMPRGAEPLSDETLYFMYVVLSLLGLFSYAYVQAIRHRRSPHAHGAYMAATALTLVDPIGARLLYHHLDVTPPAMQLVTYAATDLALVALVVWEARRTAGPRVFPHLLALFVIVQLPTFFVWQWPLWRAFTHAVGGLPPP